MCIYGEDKRQATSRVTKEKISSLATSMEHIEGILHRLDDRLFLLEDGRPAARLGKEDSRETDSLLSSPEHLVRQEQPIELSGSENPQVDHMSESASPEAHRTSIQANIESPRQEPVSPHAVTYILNDQESVSSYGVSSAFRYRDMRGMAGRQVASPASCASAENWHETTREHRKMQLVVVAALQRQIEAHSFLSPTHPFEGLDWDTIHHLLDIHWNRHHLMFLLTYRPLVMQNFHSDGPYANKLLWYAIFYASALHSQRRDVSGCGSASQGLKQVFYDQFKMLLPEQMEKSSIPSVTALLLMGSSLVSSGQHTAGWMYCGLAYRMITDLGLHLDEAKSRPSQPPPQPSLNQMSNSEKEMCRRIFWSAYIIDKFQSLYFGRLPDLNRTGYEPSQIFLDTYEEMDLWSPYVDPQSPAKEQPSYNPLPTYVVATFNALLRLAEIAADIIQIFYHPSAPSISSLDAKKSLRDIQRRLQLWQNVLPKQLRFNPEVDLTLPPHQITCHTTFHLLNVLLRRPFLSEGHLSHIQMEDDSLRAICVSSAAHIYHISQRYEQSFGFQHAPYLFSYALFSAATVVPNQSDQAGFPHFVLRALTAIQKGANRGLMKPILIIRDLFARTGVSMDDINDSNLPQPSRPMQPLDAINPAQDCLPSLDNAASDVNLDDRLKSTLCETWDTWDWDSQLPPLDGSDLLFGLFQ
ncbi:hypothetical protein N7448_004441 [Penicillium atrosanguineum]|nr:hypothetical protein N7448_004441 [Penicillium atrosanguineum]